VQAHVDVTERRVVAGAGEVLVVRVNLGTGVGGAFAISSIAFGLWAWA
jgi:hypothetical protein